MTPGLVAIACATALLVALFMEGWAAVLHGYVWHRLLWWVHRSHHRRRLGRFETNDVLSALHAPIATTLIVCGCRAPAGLASALMLGAGYGMTTFGVAYLVCHDGFVHRRLPVAFLARFPYLVRVARAHRIHHALGGRPYGFFAAPFGRDVTLHERARARRASPSATGSLRTSTPALRNRPRVDDSRPRGENG